MHPESDESSERGEPEHLPRPELTADGQGGDEQLTALIEGVEADPTFRQRMAEIDRLLGL